MCSLTAEVDQTGLVHCRCCYQIPEQSVGEPVFNQVSQTQSTDQCF